MACSSCSCAEELKVLTDALHAHNVLLSGSANARDVAWRTSYSTMHLLEREIKKFSEKKCKCKCGCK